MNNNSSHQPDIVGQSVLTSRVVREMVSAVPWGHHANALIRVTDPSARLWYLQATARFGWTRNVLLNQIKAGAYERAVADKKSHNFGLALPAHLADQAEEMLKSSYNLEFLGIRRAVRERELEDRLISRLQAFLMELGSDFCLHPSNFSSYPNPSRTKNSLGVITCMP